MGMAVDNLNWGMDSLAKKVMRVFPFSKLRTLTRKIFKSKSRPQFSFFDISSANNEGRDWYDRRDHPRATCRVRAQAGLVLHTVG